MLLSQLGLTDKLFERYLFALACFCECAVDGVVPVAMEVMRLSLNRFYCFVGGISVVRVVAIFHLCFYALSTASCRCFNGSCNSPVACEWLSSSIY